MLKPEYALLDAEPELLEYLRQRVGAECLSDLHTEDYRLAALREFLRILPMRYPDAAWCDAAAYLTGCCTPPQDTAQAFALVEDTLKNL